MKNTIEQYPKNKDFEDSILSVYQIEVRDNQKIFKYKKTKVCNRCFHELPIKEFYVKDKNTKRRANLCRDCQMRDADVIEIGKIRFAKDILKKGFRRCSVCKEIKPLTAYSKTATSYGGYSNNCYECSNRLHGEYYRKQRNEIGDHYVRQYGLRLGISVFSDELIKQLRSEIIQKRKAKYFHDGNEFNTLCEFAKYIEKKYNIPTSTTVKRVYLGAKEHDCIIPEKEYRSLHSGTNKGRIKVTDTVSGGVFVFFNTSDTELLKMFGKSTINEGIKSGMPVGGRRSKYKNPCIIERIKNI